MARIRLARRYAAHETGTCQHGLDQGSDQLLAALMRQLCQEAAIPSLLGVQERLEITQRKRADGRNVYFLLNHGEKAEEVILPERKFTSLLNSVQLEGRIEVAARDIAVLLDGKIGEV